jgi:hypothetical protein
VREARLENEVEKALKRLKYTIKRAVPRSSERILAWLHSLSRNRRLMHYWTAESAFPMLRLPWFLEEDFCKDITPRLQPDLIYSSISIYCFIRLVDNVVDRDVETDLKLLPALGLFHSEFHRIYLRHFNHEHPFWKYFTKLWYESIDVTILDAVTRHFDFPTFRDVAAKKTCAAKIPIAAVAYKYGKAELIPAWSRFLDRYGCWSQMLNDTFDWHKDLASNNNTFFLSEAGRRKTSGESIAEWVVREGFSWSMDLLESWMNEMQALAEQTRSSGLVKYIRKRQQTFGKQQRKSSEGVSNLARLSAALKCTDKDR